MKIPARIDLREPPPFVAPPDIADHELMRRIGHGSYGEVWLGRSVMGAWRAIKIVRRGAENSSGFQRELAGIRKFEPISRSSSGFVHILQIGQDPADGYFYYVMELADDGNQDEQWSASHGASLRGELNPDTYVARTLSLERRKRGRLPAQQCLEIASVLTEALADLHEHGLVHRDIKPANIIFVKGQAKLADIGLVAEMSEASSYVGTEGYIAPEGPNSPQGDIYSLGKVLYEISTGKDRQDFPEPITLVEPAEREFYRELNAIITKACHPEITRRYRHTREFQEDIKLILAGKSVREKRRRSRRAKVLFCFAVAAGGFAIAGLEFERRTDRKITAVQGESSPIPLALRGKVPARPVTTPRRLIDLSSLYNASLVEGWYPGPADNTLGSLSPGLVELAGTRFDVRGLIQLVGGEIRAHGARQYPLEIAHIRIAQWVTRLHFLHGTISEVADGTVIGRYRVHYSNATRLEVPIIYGVNVRSLWQPSDMDGTVTGALLAWQGQNGPTTARGMTLRLYKLTWENPYPEFEIESLDFISDLKNPAPFVVAVTADDVPAPASQQLTPHEVLHRLQRETATFPEVRQGTKMEKIQFSARPIEIAGAHYRALRFRTPAHEQRDLLWAASVPPSLQGAEWYILPVRGHMKEGFEDWWHLEGTRPSDRQSRVQFLSGKKLQADTEYLLWFRLKKSEPVELDILLKFLSPGSVDPNKPAELLRALQPGEEWERSKAHRHYCFGKLN